MNLPHFESTPECFFAWFDQHSSQLCEEGLGCGLPIVCSAERISVPRVCDNLLDQSFPRGELDTVFPLSVINQSAY
jgi:hypothetical protein